MVGPVAQRTVARWLTVAGVCGALAVALGAFGAHYLPDWLRDRQIDPDTVLRRIDQFEVGVRYHLAHAVALLALCGVGSRLTPRSFSVIAWLMLAGIVLFSGSLYLLVATDTPGWGAVTPLGGLCWIAAWIALAVAARP